MANSSLCAVPGCSKPAYLGAMCSMHRTRLNRHGTLELPDRKPTRKPLAELLGGITTFGDLTVIGERDGARVPGNGAPRLLLCRCACGREKLYPMGNIIRGKSKSCGCKRAARVSVSKMRHGQNIKGKATPEYRAWTHIIGRCENPNDGDYANYGGRGIGICQRWRGSFEAFFADMGPRPPGTSIDRIDVNGNYEPGNCRWATKQTQDRNRRTNRWLTAHGKTMCLKDWADSLGLHRSTIERRLARGVNDVDALAPPRRR